ncbi:MAG: hypothetical protein GC205_09860 [Bacteroidetes bacterium]|nr:hypothetical protein [Bacteroidota bacterium]
MRYFLTISSVILSWTLPGFVENIQLYLFLWVVGTIGMAHGSLDHLVHRASEKGNRGMLRFYAGYLLACGVVAMVWWLQPLMGLGLFIASSAYHFGQAEIPGLPGNTSLSLWVRRSSWGIALLMIPLIAHSQAIQRSLLEWQFATSGQALQQSGLAILIFAAGCYGLASLGGLPPKGNAFQRASLLPVASWIGYAFLLWVTPPLWGFTLYFGIWHAWPALEKLATALQLNQKKDWLKALLPNYFPSLLATLCWIWLASWWAPEYMVAGLLVLLSALTVPHTFVFERLYRKG